MIEMVSKNTILISVNKETKKDLDKLKLHPSLSYNDVIVGLIKEHKSYLSDFEKSVQKIKQENPEEAEVDFETELPLTAEEIKFTEAEAKTDTST